MTFNILNRREVEKGRYYWDYCSSVEVRLIILCLNWLCGITLTGKVNWNQAYPPFWSACCRMSCTVLGWTKPYCVPLRKKKYIYHCIAETRLKCTQLSFQQKMSILYHIYCEQQNIQLTKQQNKEEQEEESSWLSHILAWSLQPADNKAHIHSVSS